MTRIADQPSPARLAALIMIGLGFFALGVFFLIKPQERLSGSSADFSAVPVEVNLPSPTLLLEDLQGNPVSLSDYEGNVILVNLWATWCPPCREEMPTLQAFYEKYKPNGFVLIAIDQGESLEQTLPFVTENNLSFPVWLDPSGEAGRVFNTMSLPSSYVIDREGRIRLMWIGAISEQNLEKYAPGIILENQ